MPWGASSAGETRERPSLGPRSAPRPTRASTASQRSLVRAADAVRARTGRARRDREAAAPPGPGVAPEAAPHPRAWLRAAPRRPPLRTCLPRGQPGRGRPTGSRPLGARRARTRARCRPHSKLRGGRGRSQPGPATAWNCPEAPARLAASAVRIGRPSLLAPGWARPLSGLSATAQAGEHPRGGWVRASGTRQRPGRARRAAVGTSARTCAPVSCGGSRGPARHTRRGRRRLCGATAATAKAISRAARAGLAARSGFWCPWFPAGSADAGARAGRDAPWSRTAERGDAVGPAALGHGPRSCVCGWSA